MSRTRTIAFIAATATTTTTTIASALVLLAACASDRRVEAPVVDLAIPPLDASTAYQIVPKPIEPQRESTGIAGRWEGIGTQNDGLSWPMVVELSSTSAGVCASVDYPSIPCRAEWICTREDRGTLEAQEHLLDDSARRCIDNGTMTMRLTSDGLLDWRWAGQGETATARLRRSP